MMRVHQKIQQRVINLVADYDLTLAQFDVLVRLNNQEGITQQQLADRLLVTKGNVTGLIDRLSQQGLVERRNDPEDRRSHLLFLTDKSRTLLTEVLPPHKNQLHTIMDALSTEEQQTLLTLIRKLENSLD